MLQPGSKLNGRYEIQAVLGEGGMGFVYLALDQTLGGKKVAVKEMAVHIARPDDKARALRQFREEAHLLASLEHPRLVPVSDFFQESDNAYLVMAFVDGQTLAQAMHAPGLTVSEMVTWIDQIAEVLEFLHEQEPPVLFRDLKPSNVMLNRRGQVRLIDFGIARTLEAGQSTSTFLKGAGTAEFAPVEQFGGRGTDARSDIYSLGATMYNLLTGDLPPISVDVMAGEAEAAAPRAVNPAIPAALTAIIVRAMALRKEDRYPTVSALRADLSRLAPGDLAHPLFAPSHRPLAAPRTPDLPTLPPTPQTLKVDIERDTQSLPPPQGATALRTPPPADPPRWRVPPVDEWRTDPYFRQSPDSGTRKTAMIAVIALVLAGVAWFAFNRLGSTGRMAVSSTPAGARVWLDGAKIGTTPMTLAGVRRGTHSLMLEADGAEPQTIAFSVAAGRVTVRPGFAGELDDSLPSLPRLSLTLAPKMGTLVVRARPQGAQVDIDGKRVRDHAAGEEQITVTAGPHTIRVSAAGHAPVEKNVDVAWKQMVPLEAALRSSAAAKGTLLVEASPTGARVVVDAKTAGKAPVQMSLEAGRHTVRVEKDGCKVYETAVTVRSGENQRLVANLLPQAVAAATPVATPTVTDVPAPVLVRDNGTVHVPDSRPSQSTPPVVVELPEPQPPATEIDDRQFPRHPPIGTRRASADRVNLMVFALKKVRFQGEREWVERKMLDEMQKNQYPDIPERMNQVRKILDAATRMPLNEFRQHHMQMAAALAELAP